MNWEEELLNNKLFIAISEKTGITYKVFEAEGTITFIKALLKEQRENCQQNYKIESMDRIARHRKQGRTHYLPISARVSQAIANAPEPTGEK